MSIYPIQMVINGESYFYDERYNYQRINELVPHVVGDTAILSNYDSYTFANIKFNGRGLIERTSATGFSMYNDKNLFSLSKADTEKLLRYMIKNNSSKLFFDTANGIPVYDITNAKMLVTFDYYVPSELLAEGSVLIVVGQNSKTRSTQLMTIPVWTATRLYLYPMLRQSSELFVDPKYFGAEISATGKLLALAITATELKSQIPSSITMERIANTLHPEVDPRPFFGIMTPPQEKPPKKEIIDGLSHITLERLAEKFLDIYVLARREPALEKVQEPVILDGWKNIRAFKKVKVRKLIYEPFTEEINVYFEEKVNTDKLKDIRKKLDSFINFQKDYDDDDWISIFFVQPK